MLLLFAACAEPDCLVGAPVVSLFPEVVQAGDTPVHRVSWTTDAPATAEVSYGVAGLEQVLYDDEVGTEHAVVVAGIAAGDAWQLQAVSRAGDQVWISDVIAVAAVDAPADVPVPAVVVPPDDEIGGFELTPAWAGTTYITVIDRQGAPVWWAPVTARQTHRARYRDDPPAISWVDYDATSDAAWFVTSTLDLVQSRVLAPEAIHHDFAPLPEGGFVALVSDARTVDGTVVNGDALQEIAPDGSTRELWNSWDHYAWNGDGILSDNGEVDWPHANSLWYDGEDRKVLLSLFFLDAVVQIDRDSGAVDWQLGGDASDWEVVGGGFSGQHAPVLVNEGRSLVLMDNGRTGMGPSAAEACVYDLDFDTRVATLRWSFDDDLGHEGVLLGNVSWVSDDDIVVNWGSAGLLQRISAAGDVRWEVAYPLGEYALFSEHIADFSPGGL